MARSLGRAQERVVHVRVSHHHSEHTVFLLTRQCGVYCAIITSQINVNCAFI